MDAPFKFAAALLTAALMVAALLITRPAQAAPDSPALDGRLPASRALDGKSQDALSAELGRVTRDYAIETIRDADRARRALDATAAARIEHDRDFQAKRYECHQRIAINRCLDTINADRRLFEGKLRAIDIHARQVIREANLTERNQAEARRKAQDSAAAKTDGRPGTTSAERQAQQRERLDRRQTTADQGKQAALAETKRRLARQAELDQKRRAHAVKLEDGRRKAKLAQEREAIDRKARERKAAERAERQARQAAKSKPP